MDKLKIECIVEYLDQPNGKLIRHGGGEPVTPLEFLRKHLELAK